jgi:hypothetical protein
MKLSAILAPLIAAGVPGEVILATVKAFEDQQTDSTEKGKEKARARWRKWKDNQPTNVSKRLPTTANASNLLVRVEDSSSKKDISGKEEKKDRAPAAPSPRDELEKVLDSEHAAAVIDHRQRLRKPLSSHAAKLLAAKFAAFPDANAAADKMIEAGWLKIEPHWGQERPNSTAPPPPRNAGERAFLRLQAENGHDPTDTISKRLEPGDGRRQIEGNGDAWPLAGAQGAFGGN